MLIRAVASAHPVSNMLNKLHGQPDSYDKKSKYRFGRTLGAGTYGIVREAEGPTGKVCPFPKSKIVAVVLGSDEFLGRSEDHPQEECQGERADGIR
jgi:hypothetical protein